MPETVSKAEGVRRAMAEGLDDIVDFLEKRFGIEMPRAQISAYKSQSNAKERQLLAKHGADGLVELIDALK